MKRFSLFLMIVVVAIFMLTGCNGGDGDGDSSSPTIPAGSLDFTGTYRFQTNPVPTSGDCTGIAANYSGTMTLAHITVTSFTVTSCTYDDGELCLPVGYTGTIQDSLVTLSQNLVFGDISYQVTMTGTVTDTSNFSLAGQGTKEPGTCQFTITGTWTRS